jgi:putative endonuclease
MVFYVYILKSNTHNRRYIGSCKDLKIRLHSHNAGKVKSSKPYRPYEVIYTEEYPSRTDAIKREKFFKTIDGYNFLRSKGIYD